MEQLMKTLDDPVCSQIIQILRVHGELSVAEILAHAPQLSRATVYRRMERMLETGAVQIAETLKVRGQCKHRYAIGKIWMGASDTGEDCESLVTMGLMQILDRYKQYFAGGDVDAQRDRLFLSHYAISLNDADFSAMLQQIFAIVDSYQNKQTADGARLRSLFLLSAPEGGRHE